MDLQRHHGLGRRLCRPPRGLDGQFDFVLYFAASMALTTDAPNRGMLHVDYWTRASQEHYPAGAIMTPYKLSETNQSGLVHSGKHRQVLTGRSERSP